MKIQDFEKAIEALNCAIDIDEFKMLKGSVRRCIANTEQMHLEWDEFGRAYGYSFGDETDVPVLLRQAEFDLKFD